MKKEEVEEIAMACAVLLGEEPKEFEFDESEYEVDRQIKAASSAGYTFVAVPPCCFAP